MSVTKLHDALATCPECKSTEWKIMLDQFGFKWEHIKGFRCTLCGFEVIIKEI